MVMRMEWEESLSPLFPPRKGAVRARERTRRQQKRHRSAPLAFAAVALGTRARTSDPDVLARASSVCGADNAGIDSGEQPPREPEAQAWPNRQERQRLPASPCLSNCETTTIWVRCLKPLMMRVLPVSAKDSLVSSKGTVDVQWVGKLGSGLSQLAPNPGVSQLFEREPDGNQK